MCLNYSKKPAWLAVDTVGGANLQQGGTVQEGGSTCTSQLVSRGAGSRAMASVAPVTVQRALKGKQKGNCFPKAGKAKEKESEHLHFYSISLLQI